MAPITASHLKEVYEAQKTVFFLFGASLIVLIAACKNCDSYYVVTNYYYGYKDCTGYNAWAVACSVVSVAFTLTPIVTAVFSAGKRKAISIEKDRYFEPGDW